jgi:Bacterial dnaA protein helix-turn-helix
VSLTERSVVPYVHGSLHNARWRAYQPAPHLHRPPNAVPDTGIDLKRKPANFRAFEGRVPQTTRYVVDNSPSKWWPDLLEFNAELRKVSGVYGIEAREVLPPQPSANRIIIATAKHFGVPARQIKGHRRNAAIVKARQVAMYLAGVLTNKSLPQVGRSFDKDHTTVLHAQRKIAGLILTDSALAADVAALRAVLTAFTPTVTKDSQCV